MNNVELEKKILEIISEDNYFEMVSKAIAFDKEYKTSDFYKLTKKPLMEVIKETKIYYALQLRDMTRYIQAMINGLSMEKITALLDEATDMFNKESADVTSAVEALKDLH
jgi:hypothetical protein